MSANEQIKKLELQVKFAWISITSITFFTVALHGKSAILDLMIIGMYTAHILYTLYVWRHLAIFFNENQE